MELLGSRSELWPWEFREIKATKGLREIRDIKGIRGIRVTKDGRGLRA